MDAKKKVNVGLIGLGRIGEIHAKNLAREIRNAKLVHIAETEFGRAGKFVVYEELGDVEITADYSAFLENKKIDAVVVCSPTDTHAEIICRLAKAGKHIFCEKPIALSLEEIDKALEAVKKAGVKFQVGFNRRFDPDFAFIKQKIKDFGLVRKVKIISRDPFPPPIDYIKTSGGLFLDMAIHDFDMLRFLVNSRPLKISAKGEAKINFEFGRAGDIDTAETMVEFCDGTMGSIDNCRYSADGYDQRVEIFGSEGKIFNKNPRVNNVVFSNKEGEHLSETQNFFLKRYKESYVIEMQSFIDAVQKDTQPMVSGHDGRMAAVMALAAQKSLEQGRPISLETVEDEHKKKMKRQERKKK